MSETNNGPAPVQVDESAAFEMELDRLAALSALDYERQRQDAAKRFGVSVTRVDRLVKERKEGDKENKQTQDFFPVAEPCPEAVDPLQLAEVVLTLFRRFIVTTSESFIVLVLWVMVTWLGADAPLKVFTYLGLIRK